MSRRAVFLDRDGVINGYTYDPETGIVDSPANPESFALLPGVGEAIGELNRMGLLVLVVSNQPGVAKGKFSRTLLEGVTKKMNDCVEACGSRLDGVYYCLHHPEATLRRLRKARPQACYLFCRHIKTQFNRFPLKLLGALSTLCGIRLARHRRTARTRGGWVHAQAISCGLTPA